MKAIKKEPTTLTMAPASSSSPQPTTESSKSATPAFLEKLFDILDEASPYGHMISWQPDGCSFIIKKVHEFSEHVLPKYFKHSNIQSYIRQLNMYGFSKTRHDSNHREFTHKLFRRGRRDLLKLIKRKSQTHAAADPSALSAAAAAAGAEGTGLDGFPAGFPVGFPGMGQEGFMDFEHLKVTSDLITDTGFHTISTAGSSAGSAGDRIRDLEHRLTHLSAMYHTLATKHNRLCEALSLDCSDSDCTDNDSTSWKPMDIAGDCLSRLNSNTSTGSKRSSEQQGGDGKRSKSFLHLQTHNRMQGIDAIAVAAHILSGTSSSSSAGNGTKQEVVGEYLLRQGGGGLIKSFSYG